MNATIQEAHNYFFIELDKRPISAAPSFLNDEVDYFINSAYLTLVKQKFTGHNTLQQGFEDSTKRISDLQGLLRQVELQGSIGGSYAKNECVFPVTNKDDVYLPISYTFKYSSEKFIDAILVDHMQISNFRLSDINNPWIPVPACIYEQNDIRVCIDPLRLTEITSGYPKLLLSYIKYPAIMDYNIVGQKFEVEFVDEIISLAVDYALDNVEAQRIQTHLPLTQNKE